MKYICILLFIINISIINAQEKNEPLPLVPSQRIWSGANHNGFGDIIVFKGQLYATFREGNGHVPGKIGVIRVLRKEGEDWRSVALIERAGIDLRDPHFSIRPDGRLLITCGGAFYNFGLQQWATHIVETQDGENWSGPMPAAGLSGNNWFFRLNWYNGVGYAAANICKIDTSTLTVDTKNRDLVLFKTKDGYNYEKVSKIDVPDTNAPCEGSVHFDQNGKMTVLIRSAGGRDFLGTLAQSNPPYVQYDFHPLDIKFGGPNLVYLPNGAPLIGTREYGTERTDDKISTIFYALDKGMKPRRIFEVPSFLETGYPGFAISDNHLYILYYSSHESKEIYRETSIYLSKISLGEVYEFMK